MVDCRQHRATLPRMSDVGQGLRPLRPPYFGGGDADQRSLSHRGEGYLRALLDRIRTSGIGIVCVSPLIDICPVEELPPGEKRLVEWEDLEIGVINCRGEIFAIEDRCSHDDGELVEGELDDEDCVIECPRHGSRFDLRTGKPLNLPAYVPVDTFPVLVEDGVIRVEVD